MIKYRKAETKVAILLLAPSVIGLLIFTMIPFVDTVRRSFFNTRGDIFVGVENYSNVMENRAFHLAMYNTGRFVMMCIPILLIVSFAIAIFLRGIGTTGEYFKTIFLIPIAIPVVSVSLLWIVLFHKQGVLNGLLVAVGGNPIDFMNSSIVFWVLITTYLWKNIGYTTILWSVGMNDISDTLYQASSMDGANGYQQFRYITLPCLQSTAFMITTLSLINVFKVFREAYLVAGNYPYESIYLLQHLLNNWFRELDLGRITAASVLLLLLLLGLIGMLRILWKEEWNDV